MTQRKSKEEWRAEWSAKLRDPRWQRRRLEIMGRDDFACVFCGCKDRTLNVHHLRYVWGRQPWDYADLELVTLCEDCHKEETDGRKPAEEMLIEALRFMRVSASAIESMAVTLSSLVNANAPKHGQEAFNLLDDLAGQMGWDEIGGKARIEALVSELWAEAQNIQRQKPVDGMAP